jgi:quercetin dioxygenase-like cupin family protein
VERPFAIHPEHYKYFSAAGRSVSHLYSSPQTDILLVCWEPGQESSFHDHGDSEAITFVMEGSITANPGMPDAVVAAAGDVLVTPQGVKHKLVNHTGSRAIGLHFYTPRLQAEKPASPPFRDLKREVLEAAKPSGNR